MNRTSQRSSCVVAVLMALMLSGVTLPVAAQESQVDVDTLESSIKAPDTPEARATMQEQTAALNASSSDVLSSTAAVRTSIKIYLSHNKSLLEEAFYHLANLGPYANFQERIYLQKLQALKDNKERHERQEIDVARFNTMVLRAERIYTDEVEAARDLLSEKNARLREICVNLADNVEDVRKNLTAAQLDEIPRELSQRIVDLRARPIWTDFSVPSDVGREIRRALEQAPGDPPQDIISCVLHAFDPYQDFGADTIIDPNLARDIANRYE